MAIYIWGWQRVAFFSRVDLIYIWHYNLQRILLAIVLTNMSRGLGVGLLKYIILRKSNEICKLFRVLLMKACATN